MALIYYKPRLTVKPALVITKYHTKRRLRHMTNLDYNRLLLMLFGKTEEEIQSILKDDYELEVLTQQYLKQLKDRHPDS